jgi:soluble lytic murein transglycosylase-like protein
VKGHKKSGAFTDECVIAVCWKESSFDPSSQSSASTAKGLMQMTNPAVDTVNRLTLSRMHYEYADMLDASKAIECGTYYLQWCADQCGGDESKSLNKYAGVAGYSGNVVDAENCLLAGADPPMSCLKKIHSFRIERQKRDLVDDK